MPNLDLSSAQVRLVAQLQTHDLAATAWQLTDRFGFKAERGYLDVRRLDPSCERLRLRRLNQVIELVRAAPGAQLGHGPFDHLALRTRDVDAAVMALRAKWAALDPDVTPDGGVDLPMFWSKGVRIAFALGPENARIELCQNYASDHPGAEQQMVNVGGHDHFGVRCRDLDEATDFYGQFGFVPVSDVQIETPDGPIDIRFVSKGGYLLEIASTPQTRKPRACFAAQPAWSRIIIEAATTTQVAACHVGPNGEFVELRALAPGAAFTFDKGDLS